ncbi:MAG: hypothetical protein ACUVRH_00795 [Candidatus Bipolaricaulia bacterium]
MADLRHDFTRTYIQRLEEADLAEVNRLFRELEGQISELFARENITEENVVVNYELGLRYYGQEHTLDVPAPAKLTATDKSRLAQSFDELHLRVYGHNAPEEPKEIVSLKVIGIGKVKKPTLQTINRGGKAPAPEAKLGEREVYRGDGRYQRFSIYRRDRLLAGNAILGPAIIEEPTATTVVEEDQSCTVDQYGNLIISLG